MKSSDRKEHWEKQYSDKSPSEVSWYQLEPTLSLRLIKETGIEKDEYIIDVGGGASNLVDHLHAAGYSRLAILDISKKSLELARQRLGTKADNTEWLEADITEFLPEHLYALWHDRAVFHFLTGKTDRIKYVQALKKAVRPQGHVVLAAFAIGGPTKCSGLDIVQYDASGLLYELGEEFRLVEEASETHMTPTGKEQKFSYFRLIRR